MADQDVRWQQRQQNFNRALLLLEQAVEIPEPDITQRAGIIQFFEMAFELAWKMLKDYLEGQGFAGLHSPRAVLKKAFEVELIANGDDWLQILQDRNLVTHTYNEEMAVAVENLIRHVYYPLLRSLYAQMMEKSDQ